MKKFAALTALLVISLGASASAHPVVHLIYKSSIDGSDATGVSGPAFSEPRRVAIDQQSQNLYVATEGSRIYKFDAQTYSSAPFSALSGTEPTSVISGQSVGENGGFAVDNSGGATQGRIYAFRIGGAFQPVSLYFPSGSKATPEEFTLTKDTGTACGAEVSPDGHLWLLHAFAGGNGGVKEYLPTGGETTHKKVEEIAGPLTEEPNQACGQFAIDSHGNFYVGESSCCEYGFINKYNAEGEFQYALGEGRSSAVTVDRSDDSVYVDDSNVVLHYDSEGNVEDVFGKSEEYAPGQTFSGISSSGGIAVDEQTSQVFVTSPYENKVDVFAPAPPKTGADLTIDVTPTLSKAVFKGIVNPDGVTTTDCYFEWGKTKKYGNKVDCAEGDVFSGSADHPVTAEIPISVGSKYNVRLVVNNEEDALSNSKNFAFTPQEAPTVERLYVDELNTESARLNAQINPGQGELNYRFEYGTDSSYGTAVPVPDGQVPAQFLPKLIIETIQGLTPGATYQYRIVVNNLAGSAERSGTFSTFPQIPLLTDKCANALSRQQTGAALLPDCRSYELASAADTGGYNVESNLVAGQTPFAGFPAADGELLYGTHNGGIPGTGNPTNLGVDPYLAVRGEGGWTTRYVGIPADGTPSASPFASTVLAADQSLDTFAFGGPDICAPCFSDGTSGIPVSRKFGALVQGMAGTQKPELGAKSDGLVSKPLSADGSHLVFSSVSQFEEGGNDETGDVSIYDRSLDTHTTQVVSTDPSGNPLACLQGAGTCHSPGNGNGIAQLDISSDGSRIVIAQKIATDSDGNVYWHPYMHVGSNPHTIDLAPGTTNGVLFDGMSADGTKVFFTTRDQLVGADTDSNADIYVDEVGSSGPVSPQLVSVKSDGSPSNASSCHPVTEWNTVVPGPNCDAVALGGTAGVAPANGTFYFLSPELLDGTSGEEDQANLYVVKPGGHPHFVATIDSSATKPGPAPASRPTPKTLISGIPKPRTLAVNDATGDIYVEDAYREIVQRYTSSGAPHPFTEGVSAGTNELLKDNGESPLNGLSPYGWAPFEQIAVDNHPGSPIQGAVYVANGWSGSALTVFSADGKQIGTVSLPEGSGGSCGVSVEKSTGNVYVGVYGGVWRLHLISAALPLTAENYEVTKISTEGEAFGPCQTAADSLGHVYAVNCFSCEYQGNPTNLLFMSVFEDASFAPPPGPSQTGEFMTGNVQALATDPETNELFLDMGGRINVFGPLRELREVLAPGEIKNSLGIAVNGATHHLYVSSGNEVAEIGYEPDPSKPIDNPAVLHAVHQAGVRHTDDFQVSPDGRFAAFPSGAKITDYESYGHVQVYRYDAQADSTVCASCPPSNSGVFHNAALASNGNSLTADGRVFFSSRDALALRDTNGKLDAYEWNAGSVDLISAGTGPFDSGLLSASENGKDAFFFTRDNLAPGDQNGSLMRVYDAREGGGFFHIPPPPPCAASDECHGPGSQAASPAEIGSLGGTRGNLEKKARCKRGFVKQHGKCVRKRHRRNDHISQKRHGDR